MRAPGEYGVVLRRAAKRITPELEELVAETMRKSLEIAQEKFGVYQRGWPDLAYRTVDRHGDTPLLETGDTRESMYIVVDGVRGTLATTEKTLVYSEYGTSNEPPRPLVKESVRQAMREVGIDRMRFVLTRAFAGAL